ncbi:hypothetical protein [Streptomyces sp. MH60]|uniref:hypothetical protein n=1 Tax=Streptomyces sp. MH60 TaxID=1940758 RepID=UPI000D44E1FC|nr:hypothetical protein [Streptomyces sp. MH60]PPS89532.1 hypothetical protein BZZ08_01678 [Streptomyces sp. MH60]
MSEKKRPDRTVTLTEADRKFLSFALDEAADEMCHRDGFVDEDWALLERWRGLTDPPTA